MNMSSTNEILAGRKSSSKLENNFATVSQINSVILQVQVYCFKIIENIFVLNSEDLVARTI